MKIISIKEKYGSLALVAGASEGIGASFAEYLAAAGINLVLVARRKQPLDQLAETMVSKYSVSVDCISYDLSLPEAARTIKEKLDGREINLFIYNAALSYIGRFEKNSSDNHNKIASTNIVTPLEMIHLFGEPMLKRGKGAIVLMSSLAGFQGSGYIAAYAASKAFTRVLAESLWYEWKPRGVDVLACCAGSTSTPNFINTKPGKTSFLAPPVQTPREVVEECMNHLGKKPSIITGRGNRIASFFMQRIFPRKTAINIMGKNTGKMYRL